MCLSRVSNRSADTISTSFRGIFWPQSSRLYSIFESENTHFIDVLADIYQAVLYRSWFTVRHFPLVTQYINVKQLLNTRTVCHINDKQSETVRRISRRLCKFPVDFHDFHECQTPCYHSLWVPLQHLCNSVTLSSTSLTTAIKTNCTATYVLTTA